MVRYNAAPRGAERDVFPVTGALGLPVITYTALRSAGGGPLWWQGLPQRAAIGGPQSFSVRKSSDLSKGWCVRLESPWTF
jgi:hypothetical protein